jgi:hypothetical protein
MMKKLTGAIITAIPTLARAGSTPEFTKVVTRVVPKVKNIKKNVK